MKVFKFLSFVLVTSLTCASVFAGESSGSGSSSSSRPSSFIARLSEYGVGLVRGLGSFLGISGTKTVPADFVIKRSAEQIAVISTVVDLFIQMAKKSQSLEAADDAEIIAIAQIFKKFLDHLPTEGSPDARLIGNLEQICACTRSLVALHTSHADEKAVDGLYVAVCTIVAVSGRPFESLLTTITFDNGVLKSSGGLQAIVKEVCVQWPGCASTVSEICRLDATGKHINEIAPLLIPHFLKLFEAAIEQLKR